MYPMLQTAAVLFGMAGLGGLVIAVIRLRGIPRPPAWLAMGHGLLAAAGLTLLLYACFTTGIPFLAEVALGMLLVAALGGGAMNLLFHAKERALPVPFMIFHGVLAVGGLIALLVCLSQQPPENTAVVSHAALPRDFSAGRALSPHP